MAMTDAAWRASRATGRRGLVLLIMVLLLALARPAWAEKWHNIDVTGSVPRLAFTMTDAATGHAVTAKQFRGKLVMLQSATLTARMSAR